MAKEHLTSYGIAYRELKKTGYDNYSISKEGSSQILVVRWGKKALILYY